MAEETTTAQQSSSVELESLVHAALIAVSQGAVWPEGFDIGEFAKEIFEQGRRVGRVDRARDIEAAFAKGFRAGGTVARRALGTIDWSTPANPSDPEIQELTAQVPLNTEILSISENHGLTVRTSNCLIGARLRTIRDVLNSTVEQLMAIPRFDARSLDELRLVFRNIGYTIDGEHELTTEG